MSINYFAAGFCSALALDLFFDGRIRSGVLVAVLALANVGLILVRAYA